MSELCKCAKSESADPFQCVHLPWCEKISIQQERLDAAEKVVEAAKSHLKEEYGDEWNLIGEDHYCGNNHCEICPTARWTIEAIQKHEALKNE